MLIGKYMHSTDDRRCSPYIIFGVSFIVMCILFYFLYTEGFIFDYYNLLGSTINPPGITLLVTAVLVFFSVYGGDRIAVGANSRILNNMVKLITYIGQHTLYIFLYHRLFLDYFLNVFFTELNIWIKVPFYYLSMICGSLVIEMTCGFCKKFIIQSYLYKTE